MNKKEKPIPAKKPVKTYDHSISKTPDYKLPTPPPKKK